MATTSRSSTTTSRPAAAPGRCPRAGRPRPPGTPGSGPRADRSPARARPAPDDVPPAGRAGDLPAVRDDRQGLPPSWRCSPPPSRRRGKSRRARPAAGRAGPAAARTPPSSAGRSGRRRRRRGRSGPAWWPSKRARTTTAALPPGGRPRPERPAGHQGGSGDPHDQRASAHGRQYGGAGRFGPRLPAFGPAAGSGFSLW